MNTNCTNNTNRKEHKKSWQETYATPEEIKAMLSVRFIRENRSMLAALQKKDWKAFARLYNGPAYAQNGYDEKLSKAYSSFKHHTVCPRVRLRDLGIR